MKDRSLKEAIFYTLLIILMVISLCFAVKDLSGFNIGYLKLILYIIPISIVTLITLYFPAVILAISIIGAGYTAYLAIYRLGTFDLFFVKASDFLYWLQGYTIGYESFNLKYSLPFALLFIVVCTLIISLLTVGKKTSFILIITGCAAHTFFWYMYVNNARTLLLVFLFSSISVYAYKIYKKKSGEWIKTGSVATADIGRRWMINSSFIIIFALFVTYLLPLNIKPLRWEWLNDKVINIFPFVLEWRNDIMDSYSYGFSSRYESGIQGGKSHKLGGPVLLDDSIMLSIVTESNDTLYLRGIVKDFYSGNRWSKSTKSSFKYLSNDTLALPYDVNEVETYSNSVSITPKKLLTSTIFAPYKLYKISHKDNRFYVDEDSEAYFSKIVTRKETYYIEYISPYINENELRQINVSSDFNTSYVQLPSNISERVKQLSREITSEYDNDYDKVKAVVNYLRTNYIYTLQPSIVPANEEFVEHFLFEEKQGYCTYFATALAVLLRESNIPCRYVEGFMSIYEGMTNRDIKGTNAHAWVEVNFGKYGWLTFEATPAYSSVGFKEYSTLAEGNSNEQSNTEQNESQISKQEQTSRDNNRMMDESEFGTGSSDSGKKAKLKISIIVRDLLLLLLVIRLLTMVFIKLIREIGIRSSSGRVFAERYIKNLLHYYKKMDCKMCTGDTLREFFIKVKLHLDECSDNLSEVSDLLERVIYSSDIINTEERKLMENYRKKVIRHAIRRQGTFRFFWSEFILAH